MAFGDVVVLLPGILGSELARDGRAVWSPRPGAALRAVATFGGSVHDLALPADDSPARDDAGDGVVATRLLRDTHLIPGLWKIDGYGRVSEELVARLGLVRGANYFEFPYDWRRDNRAAARLLDRAARRWLHDWRKRANNPDARLVFVAHSMGGLIARYFLECLGGWEVTRGLYAIGTPFRGALDALGALAQGFRFGFGGLAVADLTDLVRSLASVYQLLPVYKCVAPHGGQGELARVVDVPGLRGVEAGRARAALAFHAEVREAVARNLADARYRASGYTTHLIVGREQPTAQGAVLSRDAATVTLRETFRGVDYGGDGIVPRVSATPIELGDARREFFVAGRHASLQNTDAVIRHLAASIADAATMRLAEPGVFEGLLPGGERPALDLRLRLRDAYAHDEPVRVAVSPSRPTESVRVEVERVEEETVAFSALAPTDRDGDAEVVLPQLAPGVYRVIARAEGAQPVADLFVVADAREGSGRAAAGDALERVAALSTPRPEAAAALELSTDVAPVPPAFTVHMRVRRGEPAAGDDDAGGLEYALEGPFDFGDPVHETIVQESLRRAQVIQPHETYRAPRAWEYVRGVFWNDDPECLLFDRNPRRTDDFSNGLSFAWQFRQFEAQASRATGVAFGQGASLLARTHFGDLQFLHAMASRDGEPAHETLANMLRWAEFAYRVARGEISGDARLRDTPAAPFFQREADWRVSALFVLEPVGELMDRAAGSLLHLVQDAHAEGHAEREVVGGRAGRIRSFHCYAHQDHGRHAHADNFQGGGTVLEKLARVPGALDAVDSSTELLTLLMHKAPWREVERALREGPFALVENPAPAGPGAHFDGH